MMDVLVAGGGLIGMAVAWRCAQRGRSVTVVDDSSGRGASHAAAGMLAPVSEATYGEERLLDLCRSSLEHYPAFVAELEKASGIDVGLRTTGTMQVGFDADDMRQLETLHAFHQELGLPVQRLTPGQARAAEPSLTPRLRGALLVQADHSVDSRALHEALVAAAEAAGVRVMHARVAELVIEGGRAAGLRLDDGARLDAATVVLALGAWSASLPGVPPLPIRPVKGQIMRLAGAAGLLSGTVRGLVRGRSVYLVPVREDGLVIGATAEEKGFDAAVTAGAVYELLRDAVEVVPGVSELELLETRVGWRPGSADNAPLLGDSSLPGLVLATGHYRNGVLLTPVTGDAVAEFIVDGALPAVAASFRADRFGAGSRR